LSGAEVAPGSTEKSLMVDIALNIRALREQIPTSVKIVAVSKTRTVSDILLAYNAGQRSFGENRVQELLSKKDQLPDDIEWHLIGHLQSNKVKFIAPFIYTVQSADSTKILSVINSEADKAGRIVDCFLQFHIAMEDTKFGFNMGEATQLLESPEYKKLTNINICGVMGMASFTVNEAIVRTEFKLLRACFETLKENYFNSNDSFKEISMGMSGDYMIALEEGSTIVRIGSLIFGERNPIISKH
jgi:pyridoxal phosphate enzyme (YggS family)